MLLWWVLENTVVIISDQSWKGDDRPIIENSKKPAVFEFLVFLFSGLTWWSGWKVGETQKPYNYLKSISREPLVVESWLIHQNDRKTSFTMDVLRHVYPSDSRKCPQNTFFVFWGLIITKLCDFPYLVNRRSYKNGWPLKMNARMDLKWVF